MTDEDIEEYRRLVMLAYATAGFTGEEAIYHSDTIIATVTEWAKS